jgi:hypothetical protein
MLRYGFQELLTATATIDGDHTNAMQLKSKSNQTVQDATNALRIVDAFKNPTQPAQPAPGMGMSMGMGGSTMGMGMGAPGFGGGGGMMATGPFGATAGNVGMGSVGMGGSVAAGAGAGGAGAAILKDLSPWPLEFFTRVTKELKARLEWYQTCIEVRGRSFFSWLS